MSLQKYSKITCTLFLCEESSEKVRSVSNIFNEIMPERKSAVSFDIVTVLNTRDENIGKMKLGLFLIHLKGESSIEVTPIGVEEFIKEKELNHFADYKNLYSETILEKMTVEDHVFKSQGTYQVIALWLSDNETPETIMQEPSFPMEKMAASTTFIVSFQE